MNYIELKKFTLAHSKILNIDDKAKIKERYEIIINISMQEIKRLELSLIPLKETINDYSGMGLRPDVFKVRELKTLLCGLRKNRPYTPYYHTTYSCFIQDLEDIYNVEGNKLFYYDDRGRKQERYSRGEFRYLIKQEIKETQRKIKQEKFKMCIHKLKLSLPNHLIYEIGTFM